MIDRLLPTARNDLALEVERLSDADFTQFGRIRPHVDAEVNAHAIAEFLEIGHAEAEVIARTDHLFDD